MVRWVAFSGEYFCFLVFGRVMKEGLRGFRYVYV